MSDCFQYPSVPVNPLLSAMFMYDVHAYAKRAMESMGFIGRHPGTMMVEMFTLGLGYELADEEWKDINEVLDNLMLDFGSGGNPMLVAHDCPELIHPLALGFDDAQYGLTERVAAFVGICAPDFDWDTKDVVTAIYKVFGAMGYSLVQMRGLDEGRVAQMGRLVVDFDWRGNHTED